VADKTPAPLRRAKIVATVGPATDSLEVLTQMMFAGADVVRLNASHGTLEDRRRRLAMVREAAQRADRCIGVLLDLGGPKIRIEGFRNGPVLLVEGAPFTIDTALAPDAGTATAVGVAYKDLPRDVEAGDALLLNDGQIVLDVLKVGSTTVETRVRIGGELSDRKGLNRQGGGISAPALSDRDREDIRFAAEEGVDFVAVSFVREASDIHEARTLLRAAGGTALLVAKIERHEAVDNLIGIIEAADVVMVARGDLGVEMGYAELTGLQKTIIHEKPRGDHGHADDGIDDPESGADARRGERRRQRRHGRHGCRHAVGGDCGGTLPGQGGGGDGTGHRRRREIPAHASALAPARGGG
jgi:pyruvate kinase